MPGKLSEADRALEAERARYRADEQTRLEFEELDPEHDFSVTTRPDQRLERRPAQPLYDEPEIQAPGQLEWDNNWSRIENAIEQGDGDEAFELMVQTDEINHGENVVFEMLDRGWAARQSGDQDAMDLVNEAVERYRARLPENIRHLFDDDAYQRHMRDNNPRTGGLTPANRHPDTQSWLDERGGAAARALTHNSFDPADIPAEEIERLHNMDASDLEDFADEVDAHNSDYSDWIRENFLGEELEGGTIGWTEEMRDREMTMISYWNSGENGQELAREMAARHGYRFNDNGTLARIPQGETNVGEAAGQAAERVRELRDGMGPPPSAADWSRAHRQYLESNRGIDEGLFDARYDDSDLDEIRTRIDDHLEHEDFDEAYALARQYDFQVDANGQVHTDRPVRPASSRRRPGRSGGMARTITDGRGTSQRDILTQPMGGGLTQVADADGVLRQVGQQHGWHVDADGVAVRTRENVEAMDDIAQTPVADEISDLMDVGAETEARELAARHGYRISANGRSLLRADAPSEIRWDGVSGTTEEFGDLVEDLADASLGGRVELEPDDLVRLRQEAYDLMEGGANESAQELLGAARYGMDPDGELSWLGPEAAAAGNANSSRLAASVHRLIEEDDLQGAIDLAERNGYELAIQGDHPVLIRREGQVADELDEVPGGAPDRSEAEMRHAQAEDLLSFFERASDSDKAKMLAGIGIGGMAMSDEGGGGGLAVAAGAIVKPGRGRLFRTTGLRGVPDYGVQSRIARETGRTLPENQRIAQEAADAQAESRLPMARENI
ncbi:MAG: hypothetical protein JRI25_23320, partial [Deltaproteobacteria bacterium]|nr:hypothetical protein [Deltaproteobacteria bacterium]